MSDPWGKDVRRLLTSIEQPAAPSDPSYAFPWGIELASGERCFVLTGAHSSISADGLGGPDADVIDYQCGDGSGTVLLRGIDKSRPLWQVNAASYVDGDWLGRVVRLGPQNIATAWY